MNPPLPPVKTVIMQTSDKISTRSQLKTVSFRLFWNAIRVYKEAVTVSVGTEYAVSTLPKSGVFVEGVVLSSYPTTSQNMEHLHVQF
jgi:hypothetical protein